MNDEGVQCGANGAGKIIFADQLRALAALSVMIVHLLGAYWLAREAVAAHIFAPVLTGPSAKSLAAISPAYFNFGPFGVALFFLVSGFVIPFSLAKTTRLRFLAARALRIYPTYIACLALSLLAVWLSSRFWGVPFTWRIADVVHNVLLVNNITGIASVDMVNWSLAIEIKFYLLACLLAPWIVRGRVFPLLAVSAGLALLILYLMYGLPASASGMRVFADQLAHDLLFIPFMFIGTLFSYRFSGLVSLARLLWSSLLLLAMFIATWPHTLLSGQYPLVPLNYVYALGAFAAAFAGRRHFRPVRPVDWLASVSYPAYVLHSLVGYVLLRFLGAMGVTYYLAAALTVAIVLALAYAVHRAVERPTQNLGRRMMRKQAGIAAGMQAVQPSPVLPARVP